MKKLFALSLLLLVIFGFSFAGYDENYSRPNKKAPQAFNPEDIAVSEPDLSYSSYTSFINQLQDQYDLMPSMSHSDVISLANSRKIRIDTADELYRFSVNVSFHEELATDDPLLTNNFSSEVKKGLMSLHYVLGDDIDYSGMKSKQFIPIGYSYLDNANQLVENVFTGVFDGRGFEISNLYLASIDYLLYEEESTGVILTYNLTNYYSMFAYNEGTIKSLGLINPTLELIDISSGLRSASNLVGLNRSDGLVEDVYVRDTRMDPFEAGIRMRVPSGTASLAYSAAGIMHTNQGTFRNSYYVSPVVVNASNISSWNYQPVVLNNNKEKDGLVFDNDVYVSEIIAPGINYTVLPVEPTLSTGEETSVLQSSSSSLLIDGDWHIYGSNYPILLGLDYVNNKYVISNALDFVAFSKLLKYTEAINDKPLYDSDYIINEDIDMSQVSTNAYKPADIEFTGSLNGLNSSNKNSYIKNLVITNGIVTAGNYSSGLFRSIGDGGEIKNITFSNASIVLNNTEIYYSSTFRIGLVSASLNGGSITNVYANVNMDLGSKPIGLSYVGGLVGQATGTLERVYVTGSIDGGIHDTSSEYSINPNYSIGGIVGTHGTSPLTIFQAKNDANITGVGYEDNVTLSSGSSPRVYMGGIIGRVTNTISVKHSFRQLVNYGDLTVSNLISTNVVQYIGGIFGLSSGVNYDWNSVYNSGTVSLLSDEVWANYGDINYISTDNNGNIKTAGIGVSNHSEAVEFIYLNNNGSFNADSFSMFKYTGLIYNEGSEPLTISQSINNSSFEFTRYVNNFSPIYFSEQNTYTLLRFVENSGDLIYRNFANTTGILNVTGISQYNNTDMQNVYYSGKIIIFDISSTQDLWVSGFTKELDEDRFIKNSLNEGEIYVSSINSSKNIYIGGIVNINKSGDLHDGDNITSRTPKASIGITNTINYSNILSGITDNVFTIQVNTPTLTHGISGVANVFAGGIATLNNGSIQDSANLGNISLTQVEESSSYATMESGGITSTTAGRVSNYRGGVITGGITAMVIGANSRIYDSSNAGDIFSISRVFSRSGGILGVSLYQEALAGLVSEVSGSSDQLIRSSILSNSINYGNVVAITSIIGQYSSSGTTNTTAAFRTSPGRYVIHTRNTTGDRPGINSSAGGIIGYGLSEMRRMINHGTVLSTDVAGGIVGATYVLGGAGQRTVVKINTAIHYGSVQALKSTAAINTYNSIKIIPSPTLDDIKGGALETNLHSFTDTNDEDYEDLSFYFPKTLGNIVFFPENKRGFGGVFGRLQRGYQGTMTSTDAGGSFDYIVNADKNVDLIGRLDQLAEFTLSEEYFLFNTQKYYSARENDTTQAVFSGFKYQTNVVNEAFVTTQRITVTRTGSILSYTWTRTVTYNLNPAVINSSITGNIVIGNNIVDTYTETTQENKSQHVVTEQRTTSWTTNPPTGWENNGYDATIEVNDNMPFTENDPLVTMSSSNMIKTPFITEDEEGAGQYMYDENFEMRDDSVTINDVPITQYIYYVRGEVLSDAFKQTRPNGMYVLTTTAGSDVGSILPANMNVTSIYNLDNPVYPSQNYDEIDISNKEVFSDEIETVYESMFQTEYNDKSELLETDQNIYLEEIGGDGTHIIDGDVDPINKRVDFEISLNNFDPTLLSTYFKVGSANISDKALLASSNYSSYYDGQNVLTLAEFKNLLHSEKDNIVSTLLIPDLSVDFSSVTPNIPYLLGSFRVYSEAAINDTYFLDSSRIDIYTTEYDVYVTFTGRIVTPDPIVISNINVDGTNFSLNNYVSSYQDYPINNSITISYSDNSNLLQPGKDMKQFVELYYGTDKVEKHHYTITGGIVSSGTYSITINPGKLIAKGNYELRYKYFSYEDYQTLNIYNDASTEGDILDLEYYSYGNFNGFDEGTLNSLINFGYELVNGPISITEIVETSIKPYLSRTSYDVDGIEGFHITLSNFAELTSIEYNGKTFNENGYAVYTFIYTITSESGDSYPYTHNITEDTISINTVYKNNNAVDVENIFATREAALTIFSVRFNIDESIANTIYNLNSLNGDYFNVNVVKDGDPLNEVLGVTFQGGNLLFIRMTDLTLPGSYVFSFNYIRDNGIEQVEVGSITIIKNEGISSYLKDMKFTEFLSTRYPIVYEANNDGTKNDTSTYIMNVYYDGIDYTGADVAGVEYIRIDGFVPNIPLENYRPRITEFLPAGATVSLGTLDEGVWTPVYGAESEVGKGATEEQLSKLNANFGEETVGGNKVVTYRVISENGEQVTYYFVTVTDVLYNVSLIFEVYFMVNGVEVLASDTNEFVDKLILLNVSNFIAYDDGVLQEATEALAVSVDDFLDFDEVNSYNNSISQFFVPTTANYNYAFGRNLSGFYQMSLNLPKTNTGLNIYQYTIKYNDEDLPLMTSKYDPLDLPNIPEREKEGFYYYVEKADRNRTRNLKIVITKLDTPSGDPYWGLTDYYNSWD